MDTKVEAKQKAEVEKQVTTKEMNLVSNIIGKGLLLRKTMREKELDNANQGEKTPNGGRSSIVAKDLD